MRRMIAKGLRRLAARIDPPTWRVITGDADQLVQALGSRRLDG